ncbi:unnamed protein product [Gongylonema pulchrum]|uniref:Uncharacterized protein n=1 Tax=Gongylonema pulchrum TaxID=637853 RepID=A0A183CWY7_9BILA|nr:unnamed protein product [Gongylonema pulchrum]
MSFVQMVPSLSSHMPISTAKLLSAILPVMYFL